MWKSRRPVPVWAWSLLSVSLVFAVCVGGWVSIGAFVLVTAGQSSSPPSGTVQVGKRVYTREEFRTLVEGKDEAGVLEAVGTPDVTSELIDVKFWYYRDTTRDTITGKVDYQTQVEFRDGKARVHY